MTSEHNTPYFLRNAADKLINKVDISYKKQLFDDL